MIKKKGFFLCWKNGKGHIELFPDFIEKVKVEGASFIQYNRNMNGLRLDIEWKTSSTSVDMDVGVDCVVSKVVSNMSCCEVGFAHSTKSKYSGFFRAIPVGKVNKSNSL